MNTSVTPTRNKTSSPQTTKTAFRTPRVEPRLVVRTTPCLDPGRLARQNPRPTCTVTSAPLRLSANGRQKPSPILLTSLAGLLPTRPVSPLADGSDFRRSASQSFGHKGEGPAPFFSKRRHKQKLDCRTTVQTVPCYFSFPSTI